jgi:hypothetical protein
MARLHSDLVANRTSKVFDVWRSQSYGYLNADWYLVLDAATALGNVRLAFEEDRAELPNTPVQRFLELAGACLLARAEIGANTSRAYLLELLDEEGYGTTWFYDDDFDAFPEDIEDFYDAWLGSGETLTAEEYFRG